MLPRTYPINSAGKVPIFVAAAGARVKFVEFIPVKEVTPGSGATNRYDEDGALDTVALASDAGLTAWVDYLPVATVSDNGRWRSDADGFIPVTDATP